jgi:hypothetical protein
MRARLWLAGTLTVAGLALGAAAARASDTVRLSLPMTPDQAAPTMNLALPPGTDADIIDVRGGGFRGGHFHGGHFHGGHFHHASFHHGHFHTGFRGWGGRGWGWGWGGRGWGWGGRWGWGWAGQPWGGWGWGVSSPGWGWSSGTFCPVVTTFPIGGTVGTFPGASLSVVPGEGIQGSAASPYFAPNPYSTGPSPYANPYMSPSLPAPPAPNDRTYPYDGGPRAPVPMPKADDQTPPPPRPMPPSSVPLEGRTVSLPGKTQFAYPAYGEEPRVTNFASDREPKTYVTTNLPRK